MKLKHMSIAAVMVALSAVSAAAQTVHVFKDVGCGCCGGWVAHMRQSGFNVQATNVMPEQMNALKAKAGITTDTASCHTAFVEGYVIEGHVPATDVARLLKTKPDAIGLSVPGMPMGSPGMEGGSPEPYQVLLINGSGSTTIFVEQ
jgi:hypothetical protein